MTLIAAADPEVAAATLALHLDELWATEGPERLGWGRIRLDRLRWIVLIPAETDGGVSSHFFVRLDARAYDLFPVDLHFVDPSDWEPVTGGRWWPRTDSSVPSPRQAWFGLHTSYQFGDGRSPGQLVCFSYTLGYYESNHNPGALERWSQGHHTVAATLNRIAEILSPAHFRGSSQ